MELDRRIQHKYVHHTKKTKGVLLIHTRSSRLQEEYLRLDKSLRRILDPLLYSFQELHRRILSKIYRRQLQKFQDVRFSGTQNNTSNRYSIGDDIYIHVRVKNFYTHKVKIALHLNIRDINDFGLISFDSELKNEFFEIPGTSEKTFTCKIYSPSLNLGTYHINLGLWCNGYREDRIRSAVELKIDSGIFDNRISTNPFPVLAKSEWV